MSTQSMFKGVFSQAGAEGRAARRLTTVAVSARRSKQRHMEETVRQSTRRLNSLREQPHSRRHARRPRVGGASAAMQASWTEAQAEALAEEDAAWSAHDPMRSLRHGETGTGAPSASSSPPRHYDAVDAETGGSIVQQNFDDLVYRALLRYGPPLPVEVVQQNNIISASSTSPTQRRPHCRTIQGGGADAGICAADDPNAVYMDEVGLRMPEFMQILRKEQPHFSVRDDCDGVPLSLMVRNCSYLRAFGGRVNYMRFVRRLPGGKTVDVERREADAEGSAMVVVLGKYKMREMPSQDGIRCGPQPWRYSYCTR
ncbi:hypothetical protein ABL78_4918 [Leptomonas seymouri]|uniref:Uncharacterized protein n=1 Tax=Leptomonas seymouri TaxID=5684 RepID=A0A0N1I474_LEPSE|nr:hypothetical protein ABL78_4918 [Leptomonas seymouri]|eukprot:KPI86015.1 hypothetical protein ABL78_4918 [Leptomonas seymouri]